MKPWSAPLGFINPESLPPIKGWAWTCVSAPMEIPPKVSVDLPLWGKDHTQSFFLGDSPETVPEKGKVLRIWYKAYHDAS